MEIALYGQSNDRDFRTRVWSPMGESAPPGAGVEVLSLNRTELETRGVRLEAGKLLGRDLLLTYGIELHRDRSTGSDTSTVTVLGLGPPSVRRSGVSRVPDARLWSLGVFAQTRLAVASRTELVLGGRYQDVTARVLKVEEEGVPDEAGDRTVVGAASVLHRPHPRVAVVASASRGFRSPNLVERFFTGPTPEGSGVWIRNPDLGAETSLNTDLGLRLRLPRITGELFLFRNALADGVRLEATGDSIGGLPAYRNVNVSRLRIRGLEAYMDVDLGRGLAAAGGFTALRCRNPEDPEDAVSEACGDRANGSVRWTPSGAPVWAEYAIRWSGERGDALPEASPVGPRIPSFLVQDLRAGLRVAGGYRITLALRNLGDVLYAESTNAGFFRPEPGRSLVVGVSASF
ncbi:MAG: TonB-dependent receptor [Gemmatimonadetes bacterium]|nr:TonB-dependent receptor [Gemmatimonadota bacterium]NIR77854.1 TonB-dependent receptor [Gemmatimonadota bacterium]NIT86396.1 TonB-dependent receptor [Gemmatimonadota bacterium]NIU32648.1 TonB-dependent receptor [Gemmatimonadota bacterium]NIU35140.1 TonB-dependent receptor [Gemmatimonadota bacterium]